MLTKHVDIFDKATPDVATLKSEERPPEGTILDYETLGGGKIAAAAVLAQRTDTVGLLRLEASYVTSRADGDMEILLKGGFSIQKPTRGRSDSFRHRKRRASPGGKRAVSWTLRLRRSTEGRRISGVSL